MSIHAEQYAVSGQACQSLCCSLLSVEDSLPSACSCKFSLTSRRTCQRSDAMRLKEKSSIVKLLH
eukprot:6221617-Amphidinium_carterae.2